MKRILLNSVLVLAPAVAAAAPETHVLVAEPPRLALAVRQASGGEIEGVDLSRLLRRFDESLERTSSLRRARWGEDWAGRCFDEPTELYACALQAASPRPDARPEVVLLLSLGRVDGGVMLQMRGFRVSDAVARRPPTREGDPWPVFRASRRVSGKVGAAIDEVFAGELRGLFASYPPEARVAIRGVQPFSALLYDGREVATVTSTSVVLHADEAGPHVLRLEHEDYGALETAMSLASGERREWQVRPVHATRRRLRSTVLWGGAGLLAVGVGVAAASAGLDSSSACASLGTEGASCPSFRFARTGGAPGLDGSDSGLPLLPIGYSVALVGASWVTGALLTEAEDEVPWLAAGLGVVLGGAALAVSLAVEPK